MRQPRVVTGAQYICQLTDKYMGPPVRSAPRSPPQYVSPMNIMAYIHRCHVIDEYIVTFVSTDE
jgi:hypothetical protein